MDFDEAIAAHSKWKTRLKAQINGSEEVDPVKLSKDDQCPLGQWLYGEGKRYSSHPQFPKLKAAHAKFHECAGKVASLSKAGHKADALSELEGPAYKGASTEVVMTIAVLRNTVEAK